MSETKGLLNYTTTISVDKTLAEMQAMLGRAGAKRVMVEWADGTPTALAFSLVTPHGERLYTLPCQVDAVHRVLTQQKADGLLRSGRADASRPQAERVAWRVLKDWLEAQLALVRTQMAELDQVMLPYLHVAAELTLYDAWADNEAKALPSGT